MGPRPQSPPTPSEALEITDEYHPRGKSQGRSPWACGTGVVLAVYGHPGKSGAAVEACASLGRGEKEETGRRVEEIGGERWWWDGQDLQGNGHHTGHERKEKATWLWW